jgi:hypothetical protein
MFNRSYAKLQPWNPSYEKFVTTKSQSLTSKELRGAAILEIHATIVKVIAEASPSEVDGQPTGEVMNAHATFEPFTNDFR